MPIDHAIVEQAAILIPRDLRSLDALHLASALSLSNELTDFVAYDIRLCSAAMNAGLPVKSPTERIYLLNSTSANTTRR